MKYFPLWFNYIQTHRSWCTAKSHSTLREHVKVSDKWLVRPLRLPRCQYGCKLKVNYGGKEEEGAGGCGVAG